jgi:hypothetical protein
MELSNIKEYIIEKYDFISTDIAELLKTQYMDIMNKENTYPYLFLFIPFLNENIESIKNKLDNTDQTSEDEEDDENENEKKEEREEKKEKEDPKKEKESKLETEMKTNKQLLTAALNMEETEKDRKTRISKFNSLDNKTYEKDKKDFIAIEHYYNIYNFKDYIKDKKNYLPTCDLDGVFYDKSDESDKKSEKDKQEVNNIKQFAKDTHKNKDISAKELVDKYLALLNEDYDDNNRYIGSFINFRNKYNDITNKKKLKQKKETDTTKVISKPIPTTTTATSINYDKMVKKDLQKLFRERNLVPRDLLIDQIRVYLKMYDKNPKDTRLDIYRKKKNTKSKPSNKKDKDKKNYEIKQIVIIDGEIKSTPVEKNIKIEANSKEFISDLSQGLFATEDIGANELIIKTEPIKTIPFKDMYSLGEADYAFGDAKYPTFAIPTSTNIIGKVNSSHNPNAKILLQKTDKVYNNMSSKDINNIMDTYDKKGLERPPYFILQMESTREIKKGDQITIDYKWSKCGTSKCVHICLCGEKNCPGHMCTGESNDDSQSSQGEVIDNDNVDNESETEDSFGSEVEDDESEDDDFGPEMDPKGRKYAEFYEEDETDILNREKDLKDSKIEILEKGTKRTKPFNNNQMTSEKEKDVNLDESSNFKYKKVNTNISTPNTQPKSKEEISKMFGFEVDPSDDDPFRSEEEIRKRYELFNEMGGFVSKNYGYLNSPKIDDIVPEKNDLFGGPTTPQQNDPFDY